MKYYGAIEGGGTKMVCAVSDPSYTNIIKESFPTTTHQETLKKIIDFFMPYKKDLLALGIGFFGPIDVNPMSPTYGFVLNTPKKGWKDFNVLGTIQQQLDVPIAWTTDVNAAAYGELKRGAGKDKNSCVYFTIGTGVGGGAIQKEMFVGSFGHTEMGHMLVHHHPDDTFEGCCPFHQDCLEGLVSGPAIEKRLGIKGEDIPQDHPFWPIFAYYLAQCAYNTTLLFSPDVIVFGGGVMKRKQLIALVRKEFELLLNNYVPTPPLEHYLVTPALENEAGIIGGLALAQKLVP